MDYRTNGGRVRFPEPSKSGPVGGRRYPTGRTADVAADDGAAPRSQIERKEKTAGSRGGATEAGLVVFGIGASRGRGAAGGGGTGA